MFDFSAMHQNLHDALKARLELVSDHAFRDRDPVGHLAALKAASGKMDALVANLPADADPTLRHYLERQSHIKALDWLRDAVSGTSNPRHH